jgi:hypothetical protein
MSEHDPPLLSPELSDRCRHRILGVVPIVPIGVEDGYAARCLLCGTPGPAMTTTVSAREVLLDMGTRSVGSTSGEEYPSMGLGFPYSPSFRAG